ncbi:MAG: cupin domain-containing protein, partial [Bacteroidota bacterium]
DRDILSGSSENQEEPIFEVYSGVELVLNLVREKKRRFTDNSKERVIHVLNGILEMEVGNEKTERFYPGDFFVIPEGFNGSWKSAGAQALRAFEIYQADI